MKKMQLHQEYSIMKIIRECKRTRSQQNEKIIKKAKNGNKKQKKFFKNFNQKKPHA